MIFTATQTLPNKSLHTNRRPPVRLRSQRFIGRWIRCQRSLPAAVGELWRSATTGGSLWVH